MPLELADKPLGEGTLSAHHLFPHGLPGLDVKRLGPALTKPLTECFGKHFGAVVESNMLRHPGLEHGIVPFQQRRRF
jgi:hypothetical protein